MPDNDHPFTDQDLDRLNEALQELTKAERLIEMGKRAGLDMSAQEQQAKDARSQALRFKQVFFPGR